MVGNMTHSSNISRGDNLPEHTVKDLEKAYKKAQDKGDTEFKIGKYAFYTSYANYLIQFLNSKNIPKDTPLCVILKESNGD